MQGTCSKLFTSGRLWHCHGTRYPCIGNCRKIHDFFSFNLQLGPDSSPSAWKAHPDDSSLTTIYQNPPRGQLHPMQQCAALQANCYLLDPEVQHENHVTRLGLRTTLKHWSVRPTVLFFAGASQRARTRGNTIPRKMHTDCPNLSQGPNRWVAPARPASGISSAGLALEMCQAWLAATYRKGIVVSVFKALIFFAPLN